MAPATFNPFATRQQQGNTRPLRVREQILHAAKYILLLTPPSQALAENEAKLQDKKAVGEAGFWEGMIPIWDSGRDLINAVQTGDKVGMVLNGTMLLWDVASIAVGVVSFEVV